MGKWSDTHALYPLFKKIEQLCEYILSASFTRSGSWRNKPVNVVASSFSHTKWIFLFAANGEILPHTFFGDTIIRMRNVRFDSTPALAIKLKTEICETFPSCLGRTTAGQTLK